MEKSCVGSDDLIYRTVSYISGNFRRQFSLEDMARDLGVSKYVLSRVFSKTFHRNFNQYLNDARLSYACTRLVNTSDTILNNCLDSGFDAIKPHQVNIGKTKDEMGKGIEVGNEKVMQEKAADILQLEEEGENLFNF